MPQPPGTINTSNNNNNIPASPGPSPTYIPNAQARGILKKDVPLTEQEEEIQKRNEELTRRLKQVEALQRSVEQQQIQAIEMCDYVQRMTLTVKEASRTPSKSSGEEKKQQDHPSGLNDDSSSADNKNNNKSDDKTPAAAAAKNDDADKNSSNLPSALRNVTPAPPSMLPDSFVKAVFEGNKEGNNNNNNNGKNKEGNNNNNSNNGDLRSTSPGTASTLNAYYAMSPNRHLQHQSGMMSEQQQQQSGSSQIQLSSRPMLVHSSGGQNNNKAMMMSPNEVEIEKRKNMMIEEAIAEVKKRMASEPHSSPAALSTQDLQDEVLRRVRAAEDMFSSRPSNEKAILRRFHLEQRQRYLSELQQAMNNGGVSAKAPSTPAFTHFRFEGESQRHFPLAVDIFVTQQELLYLLRIAQAEQPPQQQDTSYNPESSSWNGANENVFAAQQNYVYAAPVHHDLGGPLEPLAAAHISSPEPLPTSTTQNNKYSSYQQQPQQQQQRWEDLTPEQQEAARRYWANQNNTQQQPPQQPQQPQQPMQPANTGYSQPVQPQASPQPRQPVRVAAAGGQSIRPSPGLASYKARYGK